MRRVVLDANVVLKWFGPPDEAGAGEARALRAAFEGGEVEVVVPSLLVIEVLNVAGRRWRWPAADLDDLAAALDDLPWTVESPSSRDVAAWVARGLTAYDATYVALADASCRVVTADAEMLALAPDRTASLVA